MEKLRGKNDTIAFPHVHGGDEDQEDDDDDDGDDECCTLSPFFLSFMIPISTSTYKGKT